jgi:hypothetical protein
VTPDRGEWVLTVSAAGDCLWLDCLNQGPVSNRIWRRDNSWGWSMPSVEVRRAADGPALTQLMPSPRVWTMNVPRFSSVAPGDSLSLVIEPGDLVAATSLLDMAEQLAGELWIVAQLSCEPTPESVAQGVWSGTVRSGPTRMEPPHPWLPVTAL